ncbi:MAG: hypothetical protein ACSHYB_15085 [Roseibacillus sp.]
MREYSTTFEAAESLTEPGSSNPWLVWGIGLVLPLLIVFYAAKCWFTREASFPAIGNGSVLYGDAARWTAFVILAIAVFIHGRSFWGAKGFLRSHRVLSLVSCLLFIVSFFGAMVCSFAGV